MPVMTIIKNNTDTKLGTKTLEIHRYKAHQWQIQDDFVAVEEPLEICVVTQNEDVRVSHNIAITMRTPGQDAELALGFLLSEGALTKQQAVVAVHHAQAADGSEICNRIEVVLPHEASFDVERFSRHVFTSSSCGICGKITIENIRAQGLKAPQPAAMPAPEIWMSLPDRLRTQQAIFEETGGLHAVALFNNTGELIAMREDVGRHNALDKLLGHLWQEGLLPAHDHLLMLSGRASFELIQKAIVAGIPHVAAVGAPSSLAVELAKEFGLNLVGFLRDGRFNYYTPHPNSASS